MWINSSLWWAHPSCNVSLFHSYSVWLGQQQLLNWVDTSLFPLSQMTTAQPLFPHHLRGHCVLNPRGTIIPDRGLLSLGHRGRGNFRAESTLTDDSGGTTDPQSRESRKIIFQGSWTNIMTTCCHLRLLLLDLISPQQGDACPTKN